MPLLLIMENVETNCHKMCVPSLGVFAKFRRATISLIMSVRPSALNSAQSGRTYMKFYIRISFKCLFETKIQVSLTFWRRTFFQILAHPVFKM